MRIYRLLVPLCFVETGPIRMAYHFQGLSVTEFKIVLAAVGPAYVQPVTPGRYDHPSLEQLLAFVGRYPHAELKGSYYDAPTVMAGPLAQSQRTTDPRSLHSWLHIFQARIPVRVLTAPQLAAAIHEHLGIAWWRLEREGSEWMLDVSIC